MNTSSRITRNFQVTIPRDIRKKFPHLKEGDPVEFRVEENKIILILQKKIPADQLYYWSPGWQEGIREAREDIESGRILGPYEDVELALKELKEPIGEED
ncbi:MAG: AbrB/MazE/SpoVT family DNA-binding domain-containing protein [Candidatus Eremiobacteraeota bacterium]|nr:AbrB/MazE/SpoVT family DNA-binding domain-containing protein [Candidatus Eremiobacteraeota bacterium]